MIYPVWIDPCWVCSIQAQDRGLLYYNTHYSKYYVNGHFYKRTPYITDLIWHSELDLFDRLPVQEGWCLVQYTP